MRTYVSPIGYDTRRVTRPVIHTGLSGGDRVLLLRPGEESDTERASQTVADVRQLLQEIEPEATVTVERVSTDEFEATVRDCCNVLDDVPTDRETIVSLGGGARDVLLPLMVAALVFDWKIDQSLFFSDLDSTVREWPLPTLTEEVPTRTLRTLEEIVTTDGWLLLSEIADETNQSKSTVIRHVSDLEDAGMIDANTSQKSKRVRSTFSAELFWMAR